MLILPPIDDFQVDHRNRDKLDNRRGNLRYATHHEQMLNRDNQRRPDGLPRGAYRSRSGGRYRSAITSFGRHRHLGTFDTPEQAHQAWRVAAHETWGFIPGEEIP